MTLVCVLLILDSCSRKAHPTASIQSIESSRTVITRRDTTVKVRIKGDTLRNMFTIKHNDISQANSQANNQDISQGIIQEIAQGIKQDFNRPIELSELSTPYSISKVWINDGNLMHEHIQKDTILNVKIKDALVHEKSISTKKETEVKIERVNYLTGWQWFQVWVGRVLILLVIGYTLTHSFSPSKT